MVVKESQETGPRVAPGQSLKPAATDVFERLHASHAARVEKLSMMQELAQRQEAERLEELKRCTIRTSSEEEATQIYGRLYQEAQLRRQRRDKAKQEAQMQLQESLTSQCSSMSSKSQEVPRWEQLYNSAPLKEKRLGEERQRAQEEEERWLAENCIHRTADGTPEQIFDRLYREKFHREKRIEQLRAANAASSSQQLAEGSIHASCTASEADLRERTRRLYEDGLQRIERLEVARRLHNQQFKAPRRSASLGPSRFELLYSDASRSDAERKLMQECHQRDELEMCHLQLVTTPRRRETQRFSSLGAEARSARPTSTTAAGEKRTPRASTPPRPAGKAKAVPNEGEKRGKSRSVSRGSQRGKEVPPTSVRKDPAGARSATPRKAQDTQSKSRIEGRTSTPRTRARTPPAKAKPLGIEPKAGRAKTPPRAATPPPKAQSKSAAIRTGAWP